MNRGMFILCFLLFIALDRHKWKVKFWEWNRMTSKWLFVRLEIVVMIKLSEKSAVSFNLMVASSVPLDVRLKYHGITRQRTNASFFFFILFFSPFHPSFRRLWQKHLSVDVKLFQDFINGNLASWQKAFDAMPTKRQHSQWKQQQRRQATIFCRREKKIKMNEKNRQRQRWWTKIRKEEEPRK